MPSTVRGRCLCGGVQYEVTGKPLRFYHCHCGRCRKSSGTGHASNLLMTPHTGITWTQGESLLKSYKVPDAERFLTAFASNVAAPCHV